MSRVSLRARSGLSGLLALLALWLSSPAAAQTPGYTQLDVKSRVQLEVPDDWTLHDAQFRKRVAEMREKATGKPKHYETSLIVQSFPTPSKVWLRVSFVPSDRPFTQAELREMVGTDRQQLLRELADGWREGAPTMWATVGKQGMREVGRPSFAVEHLGGQLALINRYARTYPGGSHGGNEGGDAPCAPRRGDGADHHLSPRR